MKVTRSAGGVVLNKKGQVLVVNQRGRSWSLPKGHMEDGEGALEAARREIYEESGLDDLDFVKSIGSYQRDLKKLTFFLFTANSEGLRPVDPDNPEARWVDRDKVAELLTHPKDREFIIQVLQQI